MDYRLVITYDISNDKLRTQIHKLLKNYGIASQKSVFEMLVDEPQYREILESLAEKVTADGDSVRIYELCRNCIRRAQRLGDGIDLNLLEFDIIG